MKIILINNLYKPYNRGGAENVLSLLQAEFIALGHQVVTISTKPIIAEKKDEELKDSYYLFSNYYNLNKHSRLYRLLWQIINIFNIKKYYEIKKIIKKEQADLIISNNLMGLGFLSLLAINKSSAKHIHIIHDIQLLHPSGLMYHGQEKIIESKLAKLYQVVSRLFFSKKTTIVSPSKWLLDTHLSRSFFKNNKSFVLRNPWPKTDEIKLANIKNKEEDKGFLFIGQLEEHKGVDLFIEAAKNFPKYSWTIIGDGLLLKKIKEEELTSKNIKVLGRLSSEQTKEKIAQSLAVIVPSRCYENSPTVIYEASFLSVPCLAANIGGIPELIDLFGGYLFEADNAKDLIRKIKNFIEEPKSFSKKIISNNYAEDLLKVLT